MDDLFRNFIDMVDTADDEQAIKSAIKNLAAAAGFKRFAYLQTEGGQVRTFNTYPQEWHDIYFQRRYSHIDPVVTEARRRMKAFQWTAEDWPARGNSDLKSFRDQAINYGLRSGVTIPVEGSFGTVMMLTLASSDAVGRADNLATLEKATQAVLAVHYRLRAIKGVTTLAPKQALSPRELLCLKWATRGKVNHEIADLTGLNPRTVQHYLDNARRKLEAATVPQLVAIAKDHKLL